jgi:hypothetical protein
VSSQETAGVQYGALVIEQLAQERSRQASLEARGVAVVTTSGVLVSLLLGLVAATTSAKSFMLPRAAHGPLVVALGSFVFAAVLGITTNIPLPYLEPTAAALRKLHTLYYWEGAPEIASLRVSESRVGVLARARCLNNWKACAVVVAVIAQVIALGSLSIAVLNILRARR